jgi:hypothetical protein
MGLVADTMGSKGNLAREHRKAHLCLQLEILLHLVLGVLRHLGVRFHSGVCFHLHLELHHLLSKVHFPLLVPLHSHEEDYPIPKITKSRWWFSCGWLEIGHRISGRKPISGNNYLGSHCKHLDTPISFNCNNFGTLHLGKGMSHV